MDEKQGSASPPSEEAPSGLDKRFEAEGRIRNLRAQSRTGSYGLAAFILITVLAIPNSRLLPPLSAKVREVLGASPPLELIGVALIVYVFSALTLTLARLAKGQGGYHGWSHLFYIASFYIFFSYAAAGSETYWAVFVSGLVIMGLENYQMRIWCADQIRKEERKVKKAKLRGFSPS
ncbi:MAG: hypothetical protein RRA32_01785 [bacterium]|nr:hypothetical protein [bacterium]